jgi:integrase/recombinase XerD
MARITIKIVLDTRRAKLNGLYPVKLRVTFQREQKYFPVYAPGEPDPLDLSSDDFARVYGEKPREKFKILRDYLDKIDRKAKNAADSLPMFTFQAFEAAMFGVQPTKKSGDLAEAFQTKIEAFTQQGRISSAELYRHTWTSLERFKKGLMFPDITPKLLEAYRLHMDRCGHSLATTGIYLRNLRAIINEAIENKIIPKEAYPFGKSKKLYSIPKKGNKAEPLKQSDIAAIYNYQPKSGSESYARDLWVFAFLLNGANMMDVCSLKYKDIDFHGERIVFYRSKTSKTANEPKPIEVSLSSAMRAIIEKWGNFQASPDTYVFPIFERAMTAEQKYKANGNIRKMVSKYMERIAESLGIEKTNIHNYTGRDSYAAAQRLAGESGDTIGDALGHENRSTTDTYLDKFGKDVQDRMSGNALRFIGESDTNKK